MAYTGTPSSLTGYTFQGSRTCSSKGKHPTLCLAGDCWALTSLHSDWTFAVPGPCQPRLDIAHCLAGNAGFAANVLTVLCLRHSSSIVCHTDRMSSVGWWLPPLHAICSRVLNKAVPFFRLHAPKWNCHRGTRDNSTPYANLTFLLSLQTYSDQASGKQRPPPRTTLRKHCRTD